MQFVNCVLRYYETTQGRLKLAASGSSVNVLGGTLGRAPIISHSVSSGDIKYPQFIGTHLFRESNFFQPYGTESNQGVSFWQNFHNRPMGNGFSFQFQFGSQGMYTATYPDNTPDNIIFLGNNCTVIVNEDSTAEVTIPGANFRPFINVDDYLLGYNLTEGNQPAITYHGDTDIDYFPVLGRIIDISVSGDNVIVTLLGAGVNVPHIPSPGIAMRVWVNYTRSIHSPILCNMGSSTPEDMNMLLDVESIEGLMPEVGSRLEHPNIPAGTYVTGTSSDTITLSGNVSAVMDNVTIINGNPSLTCDISFSPAYTNQFPYIEGAIFKALLTETTLELADSQDRFRIVKSSFSDREDRPKLWRTITEGIQRVSTTTLRQQTTSSQNLYFVNDLKAFFLIDSSDTTTPDDGVNVIVSGTVRFKRIDREKIVDDGDRSAAIAAGTTVVRYAVKPTMSSLAGFIIGTSPSGAEILGSTPVTSGQWTIFEIPYYFESSGTLYFQGITDETEIIIYKE